VISGLARISLCLTYVRGINAAIGGGIANQDLHWDNNISQVSAVVYVTESKHDGLNVCDSGKIYGKRFARDRETPSFAS
jgi:hypothetical protein